jgi:polyisoprenoid-binding protein YceI
VVSKLAVSIGCIGLWAGSPASAAPRTYTIDGTASTARAHVGKTGIGSFAAHEHNVDAQGLQGEVMLDAANLAGSAVDLIVPTRTLTVTPEGEPDGDAPKVQEAMLGPHVLDAQRFSTIHFGSTGVKGSVKDGKYDLSVEGELTVHGVTKPVTVSVQMEQHGDLLAATGKFIIKQTDFGIEPTTVAGGLVKVENEVVLSFRISARAAP